MGQKDWWKELFVEAADSYGELLEAKVPESDAEAEFLAERLAEAGVEPGSRILDLACGIGRHAVALAERGYEVVGLDVSDDYLGRARTRADELGVDDRTDFVEGDMRELTDHFSAETFDGVINMFTSFGFFEDDTNRQVVADCAVVCRDEAVFIVDTISRDWLVRNFQSQGVVQEGELIQLEHRDFDFERGRSIADWTLLRETEEATYEVVAESTVNLRPYCLHELIGLFEDSGWDYEDVWGDLEGTEFGFDTERIVGLFRKASR